MKRTLAAVIVLILVVPVTLVLESYGTKGVEGTTTTTGHKPSTSTTASPTSTTTTFSTSTTAPPATTAPAPTRKVTAKTEPSRQTPTKNTVKGSRIVADGWNFCFSDKAAPDEISYWVRFSNGERVNRVYVTTSSDPIYLAIDIVTSLPMPKPLGCSHSTGIIEFAPT